MLMDLTEYDFTVQHHPGRQNVVADMLSRLPAAVLEQPQTPASIQAEDKDCQALRHGLSSSETDFMVINDGGDHMDVM